LWEIAEPLIPPSKVRPQGGGTQDTPDETLFAAIIYVLVTGCAWRALPPCFGISKSTAHRRFLIWSRAGVWGRLPGTGDPCTTATRSPRTFPLTMINPEIIPPAQPT
jgi:transposase